MSWRNQPLQLYRLANKKMKPANSITLFFAAAAFTAMSLPMLVEGDTTTTNKETNIVEQQQQQQQQTTEDEVSSCPSYGCPILPRDMYFDEEAQEALKTLRTLQAKLDTNNNNNNNKKKKSSPDKEEAEDQQPVVGLTVESALDLLKTAGREDQATLTLIGYKGGKLEDQINQDRAFVISPFLIMDQSTQQVKPDVPKARLMGVFDGHAKLGELVSQYSVSELPKLLSDKIHNSLDAAASGADNDEQAVKKILVDTFVQMDKTAPAEVSGGCTASVVMQLGSKIFVANAGDSRSFVATFRRSTGRVNIVYISREDKPDLPDEKARVEGMGGHVYIPNRAGASSRVIYMDSHTGFQSGLAMSRSIGDWDAGNVGVIPNPIVDVLDIQALKATPSKEQTCVATIHPKTGATIIDKNCVMSVVDEKKDDNDHDEDDDDVQVFAVSATDGMLDFVDVQDIARTVAESLYLDNGPHPLSACENLISIAAAGWWREKDGRYRDDIAIAVSKFDL